LSFASTASAAAPRYILVSGPGLEAPVLLGDWSENAELLVALINAPRVDAPGASLGERPRLRLSLFWGWPERPLPTDPADANQAGWFYPSWQALPAVIDLRVNGTRVARIAPMRVTRILSRHGVPVSTATRSTLEPTRPCEAGEARALARGFIAGFNAGARVTLDAIFAREPEFRWYSTTGPGARLRGDASNRRSLARYFSQRHAAGESLALRSFRSTGNSHDGAQTYGNFTFTLVRRIPETGTVPYQGKGAALCFDDRPDTLIVWSMAAKR
jgi:hypothetical protein